MPVRMPPTAHPAASPNGEAVLSWALIEPVLGRADQRGGGTGLAAAWAGDARPTPPPRMDHVGRPLHGQRRAPSSTVPPSAPSLVRERSHSGGHSGLCGCGRCAPTRPPASKHTREVHSHPRSRALCRRRAPRPLLGRPGRTLRRRRCRVSDLQRGIVGGYELGAALVERAQLLLGVLIGGEGRFSSRGAIMLLIWCRCSARGAVAKGQTN